MPGGRTTGTGTAPRPLPGPQQSGRSPCRGYVHLHMYPTFYGCGCGAGWGERKGQVRLCRDPLPDSENATPPTVCPPTPDPLPCPALVSAPWCSAQRNTSLGWGVQKTVSGGAVNACPPPISVTNEAWHG